MWSIIAQFIVGIFTYLKDKWNAWFSSHPTVDTEDFIKSLMEDFQSRMDEVASVIEHSTLRPVFMSIFHTVFDHQMLNLEVKIKQGEAITEQWLKSHLEQVYAITGISKLLDVTGVTKEELVEAAETFREEIMSELTYLEDKAENVITRIETSSRPLLASVLKALDSIIAEIHTQK